ncbi:hypothetical protein KC19_3G050100 [Ceratodon purpureus]|uniref:Uncharacterized protein n=1 Tax=Ceratodon purpureus TaxID=3225 RepID=A0A8T0IH15_CERPU|nr:hypothetical protein KC19_3G050100 [Ceratodon purpureus]
MAVDHHEGGEVVQKPPEIPRPFTAAVSNLLRPHHRDKESLLDELLELKNALVNQKFHLQLHIQHAGQVQEENDRLEKSVENLELAYGLEAPRVGGEGKLTSKLLGLKARLQEKQLLCNGREVEIGLLQKDIRVTHSRELEIERDLFATEVGSLQKIIRGLRRVFVRITKKSIVNSKSEIVELSRQSSEAKSAISSANSKFSQLEAHSLVLAKLKRQEECETMRLEHSIIKLGDDTRQIIKDKIAAEKAAHYAAQPAAAAPAEAKTSKGKLKEFEPDSGDADAMAQLEAEFLAQVETAAVEFIETVPASQPPSPKNEDQIKKQHTVFETRKEFFTGRVEEAEIKFVMAMEAIEYGQAKTKLGQSSTKMLAAAEKARKELEALAKQLAEDAKKAKEEAARLQAELDRLRGMGSGDKRWKSENVTIVVGTEHLKREDYKVQVADKGAAIDIDVDISKSGLLAFGGGSKEAVEAARAREAAEAKRLNELNEAMKKAQDEAKSLSDAMKKAQEERDKLAAELARLQAMGSGGKRWKSETVSVVMGDKTLSSEEYKFKVQDKGAQIDIDVQISGISSKISDELEAVKKSLLDDDTSKLIKTNIKEVLQHLENIAEVVKPKSGAGPSKHDVDSGGHS